MSAQDFIEVAAHAHQLAAERLIEAVRKAYPVGSLVFIENGRHLALKIRITGHSDNWWSDPGTIYGINIRTGKRRKFCYSAVIGTTVLLP